MSYEMAIVDKASHEICRADSPHGLRGGTYLLGGTHELWLNVTYNYSIFYYDTIDEKEGIKKLSGMDTKDSIPLLEKAIAQLSGDVSENYWDKTPGNARKALEDALQLAHMAPPNSMWDVN